jgi:hypothetical protein
MTSAVQQVNRGSVRHPQEGEGHSGFKEDVDISGKEGGLGHSFCLCLTILFSELIHSFSGADFKRGVEPQL